MFSLLSFTDKIVTRSTKFLSSLTFPGQLYVYKLSFSRSILGCGTPLISESFSLKYLINKGMSSVLELNEVNSTGTTFNL